MRAVAGTAVAFAMLGSLSTGVAQAADQKREIEVTIDPVAKAAASGDDAALCASSVPRTEVWARTHSCQTINATVHVRLNGRPVGMAKFTVQHTMDLDIESTKFTEEVKISKAQLSGEARGITASFGANCGSGCSAKDSISPFTLGSSAKTGKIDYSNPVGQGKREKRTTGYRFSLVKPGYSPGSVAYNSPFWRCDDTFYKGLFPKPAGCVFPGHSTTVIGMGVLPSIGQNIRGVQAKGIHIGEPGSGHPLHRITNKNKIIDNRNAVCDDKDKPDWGVILDPLLRPSCDEYPFASTKEGGTAMSPTNRATKWVPRWENNTQGTILSSHYKNYRVLNGDPYYVAA